MLPHRSTPRDFSAREKAALVALAIRASERMEELARAGEAVSPGLLGLALAPAFAELRNLLQPLETICDASRIAVAEVGPMLRLLGALPEDVRARLPPAAGSLTAAMNAWDDLTQLIDELQIVRHRLPPAVICIEQLLNPAAEPTVVEVLDAAERLARHQTKLVGGVQREEGVPDGTIVAPRMVAISVIATVLAQVATAQRRGPIPIRATVVGPAVHVLCRTTEAIAAAITLRLAVLLVDEGVAIDATGDGVVVRLARATPEP